MLCNVGWLPLQDLPEIEANNCWFQSCCCNFFTSNLSPESWKHPQIKAVLADFPTLQALTGCQDILYECAEYTHDAITFHHSNPLSPYSFALCYPNLQALNLLAVKCSANPRVVRKEGAIMLVNIAGRVLAPLMSIMWKFLLDLWLKKLKKYNSCHCTNCKKPIWIWDECQWLSRTSWLTIHSGSWVLWWSSRLSSPL